MCCSDYTDGNTRGFLKGLGMASAMDAVSIQDPSSFTNSVQSCLSTRSMRNDVQHAFESDAQGFKDAFKRFNVRKCDTANSSYSNGSGGGQRSYENLGRNTNGGQTTRNRENYLLELRLRWAIRRLQEHIRYVIQRKCEMRLFVILRMQYVYRRRSRIRAATTIQRFVRKFIFRREIINIQYPTILITPILPTSMIE